MAQDLYDSQDMYGAGDTQHPRSWSHSSTSHYWVDLAAGEPVIINTRDNNAMSFQMAGLVGAAFEVSNYPFEQVDPVTREYMEVQVPLPSGVMGKQRVAPNPDTVWTAAGVAISDLEIMNVAALNQIRITPATAGKLHIKLSDDDVPNPSIGPGTEPPEPPPVPEVDSTSGTLLQEIGTNNFYERFHKHDDTGAFLGFCYFDMNGTLVWETDASGAVTSGTAPAGQLEPVNQEDYETSQSCYLVKTAGAGYVVGDKIVAVHFWSTAPVAHMGTSYLNQTQGTVVSPNLTDLEECRTAQLSVHPLVVCETLADNSLKSFIRHLVYEDGLVSTTIVPYDTEMDAVTAYNVVDENAVGICSKQQGVRRTIRRWFWAGNDPSKNTADYIVGHWFRIDQIIDANGIIMFEDWMNEITGQPIAMGSRPLITDTLPDTEQRVARREEVQVGEAAAQALSFAADTTTSTGPNTGGGSLYYFAGAKIQVKPPKDIVNRSWGDVTSDLALNAFNFSVEGAQTLLRHLIYWTAAPLQSPNTNAGVVAGIDEDYGEEAGGNTQVVLSNDQEVRDFLAISRRDDTKLRTEYRNTTRLAVHYLLGNFPQ